MRLRDTFKKRTSDTKADAFKVAPLRMSPTVDDIRFCMERAGQSIGRPSALSWRTDDDTFILTATHALGSYEPTWILHVGAETLSAILWMHTTGDAQLVHSFVLQVNPAEVPKAVIPQALKPVVAEQPSDVASLLQDEFSDRCEILSRIGSGGMGVIFKAKRHDTGDIVALKVLHGHLVNEPENTRRFMQEASACLELKHRNLINVHEFGVSKRGQPFMFMEYLEGRALTEIIENGTMDLPQFINLFLQICDGLRYAHENGVVHRDVKPSNIMVVSSESGVETAKVLDFGLAKIFVEADQQQLTPTGNVLGSPAYMSPEQCAGASPDPRFDVYSLGCVMYEALSGHPPFVHESAIKVLMMQLGDPIPILSSVCQEGAVPVVLEEIIMRCLEKEPSLRYPSASDLGADLLAFAASRNRVKRNSAELPVLQSAQLAAQAAQLADEQKNKKQTLTVRFRRCRGFAEMDGVWEGLTLALKIQSRGLPVSVFLDQEAVILIMRPDISAARFSLDEQTLKRIAAMQTILQQLIRSGSIVLASERWSKRSGEAQLLPGVLLLSDEEICDLIIERSGSLIDY